MQDFGQIKTIFNEVLIEGLMKKEADSRKLFKKYLKTIKESEILKTQFLVYKNIENRVDKDFNSAALYVLENINLITSFPLSDIIKENEKLAALLGNTTRKVASNGLYESLSYLILNVPTAKSMDKRMNELKKVIDYVTNNEPTVVNEAVDLPNSMVMNVMVQKFNEKYSTIESETKDILNVLINGDSKEKQKFYTKTVTECVDIINKLLENSSDAEEIAKLNNVKVKLLGENEIKEDQFGDKIIKLIELKNKIS